MMASGGGWRSAGDFSYVDVSNVTDPFDVGERQSQGQGAPTQVFSADGSTLLARDRRQGPGGEGEGAATTRTSSTVRGVASPAPRAAPPQPPRTAQALVVGMSSDTEARSPALRKTVRDVRVVAVAVGTGALIARTAALVSWVQHPPQPYTSPYASDPAPAAHVNARDPGLNAAIILLALLALAWDVAMVASALAWAPPPRWRFLQGLLILRALIALLHTPTTAVALVFLIDAAEFALCARMATLLSPSWFSVHRGAHSSAPVTE